MVNGVKRWGSTVKAAPGAPHSISEVANLELVVGPIFGEVFEDQAAVAMFGGGFAAEQDCWEGEELWIDGGFDFAVGDQVKKGGFVFGPGELFFFVAVQHFLRGGEVGIVDVVGVADFFEEEFQVVAFGKAGQLAHVVEAHVEQAADVVLLQEREELGSGFLRETDGIDFHASSLVSAKRGI
jgi:hypothetical protein